MNLRGDHIELLGSFVELMSFDFKSLARILEYLI